MKIHGNIAKPRRGDMLIAWYVNAGLKCPVLHRFWRDFFW